MITVDHGLRQWCEDALRGRSYTLMAITYPNIGKPDDWTIVLTLDGAFYDTHGKSELAALADMVDVVKQIANA